MSAPSSMNVFCFGYSYTASYFKSHLEALGIDTDFAATTTRSDKKQRLKANGIKPYPFDEQTPLADAPYILRDTTHILISIPPQADGDLAFQHHAEVFKDLPKLKWIGYLSTTGVYGNRDGGTVTENNSTNPSSKRGSRRVLAEEQWLSLAEKHDLPVQIFRLSGIYGPGRSAIDSVIGGTARRIFKEGHVFNRIHVEDIAQTLVAAACVDTPEAGAIFNLADDHPAPSHEVIEYAATLLGRTPPPLIPYEDADLSPMARSFYKDHKIVCNRKIKEDLGISLLYPDFKSGLNACYNALHGEDKSVSMP